MPGKKTPAARAAAPTPPLPPEIAAVAATVLGLGEAALLTRDTWQSGGVEIVLANERFATLTGHPAADLAGQNTRLLHGPRTDLLGPGSARGAPAARLTEGSGWLYRKDGSEFHASWSFSPVVAGGQPAGYLVALYRDISEAKRLQEALLHSQKLDTVGLLAGGVAHDFNNLLSIINGYCEIMSGKLADAPAARKDLQEIHRAGLKAANIARQILEFSRRHETEVRVVNANTLIREIADILRRVVGEMVRVELRLATGLGNMRIDPTQFQQVLLNLCFNARDAMPQGGQLTLRTYRREWTERDADKPAGLAPGPCVVLQVTDTGSGMDEQTRAHIFEPFFTTKPHGTGLGLPTIMSIVRQAEGVITVQSEPGAGTMFEVFLPETAEPEQLSGAALSGLPTLRGTEALWIIESDEVLRKMISGILSVDGYRVREFAQVSEAAAGPGPVPQAILLDTGATGAAALVTKLREENRALKVLALAAEPPAVTLPDFPHKAMAHLPKPFAISALLRMVRGLLDTGLR